jgi:diguanylate cyclase (GGDEF)-like protein/PAS domain S-box-containing protein
MFLRPPRSFPVRLALWVGLLLAMLGAALGFIQLRIAENALLTQQEQRLRDVQSALRASLVPYAATANWQAALPALRRLRGELGLSYLVLQDGSGRSRAAVGMGAGAALPDPSPGVLQAFAMDRLFHGSLELPSGESRSAVVRYGLSLDSVAVVRSRTLLIGGAATVAALILGAGLTLVAAQGLARRMRRVQDVLAALAQGAKGFRLPAHGPKEAAALARSANAAVQALTSRSDALTAREARFHAIAEWAYGIEAWFSPLGRLVWINRSIERVTGYTPLECVLAGNLIEMLVYQKDRRFAEEQGRRALAGTSGENIELRLQRKDGSLVWVAVTWQAVRDARGKYLGLRVSLDDIQGRKEAEMQLLDTVAELRRTQSLKEFYLTRANEERARLGALLDVMKIGVLFVDRDRRVLFCNKALYRIWDVPERTPLTGLREDMLLARTAPLRADDAAYRRHVAEVLNLTETSTPYEFALVDGRMLMEISTLVPGDNPDLPIGRMWIYEDVTEQKRIADRLIQLAERDPLTNLYNRRRFHEELERMLADAARREVQLGLLVVDLDGFKPINDRYGHQAGDTVLVTLADEVGATVRRNEMFFRIGGDEFAILATDSSEEEMIGLARRILVRITDLKFEFGGEEARLTASVGIALYPEHGGSARELVDHGDQAMYRAKTAGKNGWQVWRTRSGAA